MRIIDLSVALKNGIVSELPHMAQSITYSDHAAGAREFMEIFPGVPTQNSESQRNPGVSPAFRVLSRDSLNRVEDFSIADVGPLIVAPRFFHDC